MWVKAVFTNIHKKSNASARSFGRYIKWLNDTKLAEKNEKKKKMKLICSSSLSKTPALSIRIPLDFQLSNPPHHHPHPTVNLF